MLELNIPGFGELKIAHLIFDFNGTLAIDGKLIAEGAQLLTELAKDFKVHVVTGDTMASAHLELAHLNCELIILPKENQSIAKANYIIQHDPEHVIAIGNGRNDQQMLQLARIGIAVLGAEGLAVTALSSANIIVPDIYSACAIIKNHLRLTATLRS